MSVSPDLVVVRTVKRPLSMRCSDSPGSSSWNTTSFLANRRRLVMAKNRRRSSSESSASSGHSTLESSHPSPQPALRPSLLDRFEQHRDDFGLLQLVGAVGGHECRGELEPFRPVLCYVVGGD